MIEFAHAISISTDSALDQTNEQDTPLRVSCFFPSARGVVEMIAHDGQTVMLAATGHIRSFIAQRLNEDGEPSAKANLAPITARVVAYPTGSAFESDWIVLERARSVDPGLYTRLNEQNRRSLLVLDRQSHTWRVADTLNLECEAADLIIGPILTAKAARAMGETLDDVYELCRYPKELALAPCGTACAYKEMGRCPAACDGSEPMSDYVARFEQAWGAAEGGVARWKAELKAGIKDASAGLDFEGARAIKDQLDRVDKLPMDTLGCAKSIRDLSLLCITPSVRKGKAMLWRFDRNGLSPIVTLDSEAVGDGCSLKELLVNWASVGAYTKVDLDHDGQWLDRFALVARHWMTKPSKARRRRVTVLDLRARAIDQTLCAELRSAIDEACTPVDHGDDLDLGDEEHTHIVR